MSTAYHMVHYRSFEAKSEGKTPSLESLCRSALGQKDSSSLSLWERAQDRFFDLGDASKRQVVLNRVADLSSAVFGEMCLVQNDGLQALLQLEASKIQLSNITLAEVFSLGEKTAPQGSQFVRGLAYWLAVGNHVFFIKTQSMTTDLIHSYLDWLLNVCTSTAPKNLVFKLQAEFDKSQLGSDDIGDIQSLRISGKSAQRLSIKQAVEPGEKTVKTSRRVAERLYQFEQALPLTEVIFGKKKAAALVDSLGPDEYLAVDAQVKVRGRRTEQSRQVMKEIANDLADFTEGKVQVEGKDGKISDDDAILRVRMPFSLPHEGSSLLDFDNVADQLQEVYSRFVHDGKLKA